ncbi:hypothetical protein GCM10009765_59260 [Fodinicola feengrottensis]|uniref:Lipoprotein n=2 Tax=Fodinicola feengrottensis TaxID=435914 RepID=A0ABP4UAK1_9ACTN
MTRRGKILAGLGVSLGALVVVACGAGSPSASPAPTAASTKATDSRTDKGWTILSLSLKDDGTGDFGGTARVRNDNGGTMSATFTLTVLKAGNPVASMQGASESVAAGQTVTVDWVSQDKYVGGAGFTTAFQCDSTF